MPQIVLILVGVVGSGKSTISKSIERHIPNWIRANQDDLKGDRRKVEKLARDSLQQGFNVIIDRTNIDHKQRSHWTRIADEFGAITQSLTLETSLDVCQARLAARVDHPTLNDPVQAIKVMHSFKNTYVPVSNLETSIENSLSITEKDALFNSYNPSRDDMSPDALHDLIDRLKNAPRPPPPIFKSKVTRKPSIKKTDKDIRTFFRPQ